MAWMPLLGDSEHFLKQAVWYKKPYSFFFIKSNIVPLPSYKYIIETFSCCAGIDIGGEKP
jgi:hypothetical protein